MVAETGSTILNKQHSKIMFLCETIVRYPQYNIEASADHYF